MIGPNDNLPMTREERIREDYYYMERPPLQEIDYFTFAANLARKEARRVKADKLIEFLRRPKNA